MRISNRRTFLGILNFSKNACWLALNKFCSKPPYFNIGQALKGHDRNQVLVIVFSVYTNDWIFVYKNEQINPIWFIIHLLPVDKT